MASHYDVGIDIFSIEFLLTYSSINTCNSDVFSTIYLIHQAGVIASKAFIPVYDRAKDANINDDETHWTPDKSHIGTSDEISCIGRVSCDKGYFIDDMKKLSL
jgi:hypothetical protein